MFFVAALHKWFIGSVGRQKRQQQGHCPILGMNINGASTILSFASWVIQVPIGCQHPLMTYWQPLGAKTTATRSLLHSENERPQWVNSICSWVFGNHGIVWIFEHIMELLPTLIGKTTSYQRNNADFKLIDIASCQTSKNMLLIVDYVFLKRYYYQTAKTRASYESIDGPCWVTCWQPAQICRVWRLP